MWIVDYRISPAAALATVCALSFICYALLLVYRVFLHPLARYPGPKLAAASKWYEFYFDILKGHGGQFTWEIDRMHRKYGSIVRINPDEIHVQDPDWYETLYAGNPTHRDKWPPAAKMAGSSLGTFGTVEHNIHRKRRAANSPVFSKRAIAGAETMIQYQIQHLCNLMHQSYLKQDVVELRVRFLAFATDTVCRYVFDESMGLQDDRSKAREWSETILAVARLTPLVKQFPWVLKIALSLPVPVLQRYVPSLGRLAKFHSDMDKRAAEFLANEVNGSKDSMSQKENRSPTLFHTIHYSSLPPPEKSVQRMGKEAFVIVAAGGETTSRTLTMAIYRLLANPKMLERLNGELMTVMPDINVMPSVKSLEALPWLTAVIKETLRVSAVITSRLPLMAPNELQYHDWMIPPRTPVSLSSRTVLHDPSIFPSPHEFKPERWLAPDSEKLDRYFVAFGKGTRMCQGMNFALAEIYLALAILLRRFNFQLYDTTLERDVVVARDHFIGEAQPESKGVRVKIVSEKA